MNAYDFTPSAFLAITSRAEANHSLKVVEHD
ncbi:hypothetical protein DFO46_3406 [Rhizobium sp. AG855]|nr:hypothetical protein DFO46_3406 [Rhizobium sp. AG855]